MPICEWGGAHLAMTSWNAKKRRPQWLNTPARFFARVSSEVRSQARSATVTARKIMGASENPRGTSIMNTLY